MTSSDDPAVKIVVSGLDDWVSLAEGRSLVQVDAHDLDDVALRAETITVLGRLLTERLVRPGTLSDRFVAWHGEPDEHLDRIAEGWEDADADGWLYSVWFENTEQGDELARSVTDGG